jgi:DNA-binding protein H-NS
MARVPAEQKQADEIISMLDGLDAAGLGRIAEAAQKLHAEKKQAERDAFVARVREEAAALGYQPEQLFAPAPPTPRKSVAAAPRKRGRGVVPAAFKGPDGATWSGRGKTPGWLAELERQGRNREDFRIKEGQPDLIEQAKREHEGV